MTVDVDLRRSSLPRSRTLPKGTNVNRYVVLEPLGEGGMGTVYSAYDPELDRQVALKLVRSDHADQRRRQVHRERLLREARAMAKLRHPNVVTVYDVGEHEGQVFLAMELVDGCTLGAWLREQPRAPPEVLDVFVQAGRGLAAAHHEGLIHRDFKPDNVMVANDGRVTVMDFGLVLSTGTLSWDDPSHKGPESAGGLSQHDSLSPRRRDEDVTLSDGDESGKVPRAAATQDSTRLTGAGVLLGTPLYMAPEQLLRLETDARADQFAFCTALYEGLYHERPFEADEGDALLAAISSERFRPPPEGSRVPGRIRRAVLRGLSPDPERRWLTMDALLAVLDDDTSRRRRKRILVASAAGGLVATVLSAHVMLLTDWGTPVCQGARDKLTEVWGDSHKQKVEAAIQSTGVSYAASTWSWTQSQLDDYGERWVAMHTEACAATRIHGEQSEALLDRRVQCLEVRRKELSATIGVLARVDEDTVERVPQAVGMLSVLEPCADLERLRGKDGGLQESPRPPGADALDKELTLARTLRRAGRFEEGLDRANRAQAQAETLRYHEAEADLIKGRLLREIARYDEAESTLEVAYYDALERGEQATAIRAAAALAQVVGDNQSRVREGRWLANTAVALARGHDEGGALDAEAHYTLGNVRDAEGAYEDAVSHYRYALEVWEATLGAEHPTTAGAHNSLGTSLTSLGRFEEAEEQYHQAEGIWSNALGANHPRVAVALSNRANLLDRRGDSAEAEALHRQILVIRQAALGPEHPDVAATLTNLANALNVQGELEAAARYYRQALKIFAVTLDADHPDFATAHNGLGGVLSQQERVEEAEPHFRRALEINKKTLGDEHPGVGISRGNLGNVLFERGQYVEAEGEYRAALAVFRGALGDEHPSVGLSRRNLAIALRYQERLDDAASEAREALRVFERSLGEDHPETTIARLELGDILSRQPAARSEARTVLERALEQMLTKDANPVHRARVEKHLAALLWDDPGERDRARTLAGQALRRLGERDESDAKRLHQELQAWMDERGVSPDP